MNFISTIGATVRQLASLTTTPVRLPVSVAAGKVLANSSWATSPELEALVLKLEGELGAKKGGTFEVRGLHLINWEALGISEFAVRMATKEISESRAGFDGHYAARNPLEAMHELGHIACRHAEKRVDKFVNGEAVNGLYVRKDELEANAWAVSRLKEAGLWRQHGADMRKLVVLNWLSYNMIPSALVNVGFMGRVMMVMRGERVKWTPYEVFSIKVASKALQLGGQRLDRSILRLAEVLLASTK